MVATSEFQLPQVMVITDGRPSFKFQTMHAVKSLRKSARVMIVHVQSNKKKEVAEMLRGWVSEPDNANYRFIAGKSKLAKAYDSYVTWLRSKLAF